MDIKNLMSHVVRSVNPTTTGEQPAPELVQLSEEDLLQIIGGCCCCCCCCGGNSSGGNGGKTTLDKIIDWLF